MSTPVACLFLLATTSLAYSVGRRGVERLRLAVVSRRAPDMLGAWTFAAAMVLPLPLIAVAVAVFYAGGWPSQGGKLGKWVYSCAGATAAAFSASEVIHRTGWPGLPLAVTTFTAVNIALVVLAIVLERKFQHLPMLANGKAHVINLSTHLLGAGLAAALQWHLVAALAAVPAVVLCQLGVQSIAYRQAVESSGAFDPAMSLWSRQGWLSCAAERLSSGRLCVVAVVDVSGSDEPQVSNIIAGCLAGQDAVTMQGDRFAIVSLVNSASVWTVMEARIRGALLRAGVECAIGSCCEVKGNATQMLKVADEALGSMRRPDPTATG